MKVSISLNLIVFIFFILTFMKCANSSNTNYGTVVSASKVLIKLPLILENEKFENEYDSFQVVNFKHFTIYIRPILILNKEMINDKDDNLIEKKNGMHRDKRLTYFLFKSTDSIGYYFDSIDSKVIKKIPVKEYINTLGLLESSTYDSIYSNRFEKHINRTMLSKNIYQDVITYDNKNDMTYPDSVYLMFNNEPNFSSYSFSKKIDDKQKMKLFHVRFIFKQNYDRKYKLLIPTKEYSFEFKSDSSINLNQIEKVISRVSEFK